MTRFVSKRVVGISALVSGIRTRVSELGRCGRDMVARMMAGNLSPSIPVGSDNMR